MFRDHVLLLIISIIAAAFLAHPTCMCARSGTSSAQKQSPSQSAKNKAVQSTKLGPELEPKAVEILKATSSRLAAAHTLTFTATETFESLSRQGVPLVYASRSDVTLQRPNKLRVIMSGDGPASEFYYDGKLMMAYAPAENLVAIADAPHTIDTTLESIYHAAGIYFPFTDLIVADPYRDMAPGLRHAYYVGQSKVVGQTTTDIVACAGDGVFMQLWIGTEDKLPRAIHAIYLNDPDWRNNQIHWRHNRVRSE